jgi:hypothetical protein
MVHKATGMVRDEICTSDKKLFESDKLIELSRIDKNLPITDFCRYV